MRVCTHSTTYILCIYILLYTYICKANMCENVHACEWVTVWARVCLYVCNHVNLPLNIYIYIYIYIYIIYIFIYGI